MENNTLKSTRFQSAIVIWVVAGIMLYLTKIDANQWIDLTRWVFGIYATSEGISKGAVAYRDRVAK